MKKPLALLATLAATILLAAPAKVAIAVDDVDPFDLSAFAAPELAPADLAAPAPEAAPEPPAPADEDNDLENGDPRIANLFDDNGFHYEISSTGNFKAVMEFASERTQLVIISSQTELLGDFEIREVYSIAYKEPLTRSELSDLMNQSATKKIGAWQLETDGTLFFVAKIPADLPFEKLEAIIWAVAQTADDFEEAALGTDDF